MSRAVPACELDDLTVSYGGQVAVGPLCLRVEPGEAVALVGPSGAGKTTVLRVLSGMVTPTAGAVRLGGEDLDRLRGRRELPRRVGMVSQGLDLVPQLSVKHNVQAGALGRWGLARSLAALLLPLEHPPARAAARRLGVEHLFAKRVADLSGGEQQRVALARLLVQDPALVLADEPVASLDPARADDLLGLLCEAARERGRTLVASLHTPDLARRHFDRIVGLRAGRVTFDLPPAGVTAEVLDRVYRLIVPVEGTAGAPPADTRSPTPGSRADTG